MALISAADLVAIIMATESKQWLDTLDVLFAYAFTFIASLITIILSAKHNMTTYTWIGVIILLALMAYSLRLVPKSEYS
jgi:multidrug efflux pump subunit AcrB